MNLKGHGANEEPTSKHSNTDTNMLENYSTSCPVDKNKR